MLLKPAFIPLAVAASLTLSACAQPGPAGVSSSSAARHELAVSGSATTSPALAALTARSVRLPVLSPGRPCPTRDGAQVSPAFGLALGGVPVYPVGLGLDAVLAYGHGSAFAGSPWGGQKVLWVAAPTYRGPVLIRGRQIDGPGELRFSDGADPAASLAFPAGDSGAGNSSDAPGWRNWPSYTRVGAPGCYAYQVDGVGFTEVIPFVAWDAAGG